MVARQQISPALDEIEVSIFGPSYGECIVLHLGNDHWVVVDSCIDEESNKPASIAYLESIGLDPAESIKLIVATHWHDDHCRGLSQVVKAAPHALIAVSPALANKEFLKFANRMRKNSIAVAGSKVSEISLIFDEISERARTEGRGFVFASSRRSLYKVPQTASGHGSTCEVIALSPSDPDMLFFLERIARLMPGKLKTKRSVPSAGPNDVSIATWINIGPVSILLGADLENTSRPGSGWAAILSAANDDPPGRASFFKIPHHGSENAHNSDVWETLLVEQPIAALTPWQLAGGRLPTEDGCHAILAKTDQAFSSSDRSTTSARRGNRPPGVLRYLREGDLNLRSLRSPTGSVRLRMRNPESGQWKVKLLGAACRLADIAQ